MYSPPLPEEGGGGQGPVPDAARFDASPILADDEGRKPWLRNAAIGAGIGGVVGLAALGVMIHLDPGPFSIPAAALALGLYGATTGAVAGVIWTAVRD